MSSSLLAVLMSTLGIEACFVVLVDFMVVDFWVVVPVAAAGPCENARPTARAKAARATMERERSMVRLLGGHGEAGLSRPPGGKRRHGPMRASEHRCGWKTAECGVDARCEC